VCTAVAKGRWGLAPAFVMLVSPVPDFPPGVPVVAQDGRAVSFHVHVTHDATAGAVKRAIAGAFERLGQARCQQVFSEFADSEGRPLQHGLDELGVSGQGYLGLVVFYDGRRHPRCATQGVLAVTPRGARTVFVCAERFRQLAARDPFEAEALIIHEALHTLGLGENPPSSREITSRVISRCRH
jgi:hypothetical protein